MNKNSLILKLVAITLILMVGFASCTKEDEVNVPKEKEFIGSEGCKQCHAGHYERFIESGHPYKVMKVEGKQPQIPFAPTVQTPVGYTWNDISYTIGGYGWKMRFIDKNGFNITAVAGSQFNPENMTQSVYNGSVPKGTEKYTCGNCHTTGWKSIADGGKPQDGLPGMGGSFYAGGVHCEQCHGMGNVHAVTKKKEDIVLNNTTALCAQCHQRRFASQPLDYKQQVSGGWEMHRSQVEQLRTNKHNNALSCNSCHDVHSSTVKDDLAKGNGIIKTCTSCHPKYNNSAQFHWGATCIDCHMPKTVKNAINKNIYEGDARNHNFKINTSATAKYLTTDASGTWANLDGNGSTLDFVCYQCHIDGNGVGGKTASTKTMQELSVKAKTFHK